MIAQTQPQATTIHTPDYFTPLPLACLFPTSAPVEVDIGCGSGSFLAACAVRQPETNFLGIERLLGRIRKLDRKALRLGIRNLRLIRVEAAYCVQYLLPPQSVSACHICFPDPWPKKKHWKRRLVAPPFVENLAAVLAPAGRVFLRTDNASYFEQMLAAFAESRRFRAIAAPAKLLALPTDFEKNFTAQGIPIFHAQYRLLPPG